MRPKEPDHVWVIERKINNQWCSVSMCDKRKDARIDAKYYCQHWPDGIRIRKYIPVNRLSMEMVVK